jgi:hypothetical protein
MCDAQRTYVDGRIWWPDDEQRHMLRFALSALQVPDFELPAAA